jgi:hypothetical protein
LLDPPLLKHIVYRELLAKGRKRIITRAPEREKPGRQAARITRFLHEDAAGDYLSEPHTAPSEK